MTRILLSEADLQARDWLTDRFREAGLQVRSDPAGNLFARWEGSRPDLPAVATGSHCDAIPYSGRYDGTVGVLCGLAAIRALRGAGFAPSRSIELIMFTAEEPTRFGIGCLGSRLLSGALAPEETDQLRDPAGTTFADARRAAGWHGRLEEVPLGQQAYAAFVELHIEQGPLLERAGIPIGSVTHIAAPAALRVEFAGPGGHAGAVLMADRRDALLPAAELVLAVDRCARESGSSDTVATTGVLEVHPGAINSIPSRTRLEIDVRDIELSRRDRVLARIETEAAACGQRHDQTAAVELIHADPPAACDPRIVEEIAEACREADCPHQEMISRAYHDALFMARICPTGMIFIPCRDGVSHRPEEYVDPRDLVLGSHVLARLLRSLAT